MDNTCKYERQKTKSSRKKNHRQISSLHSVGKYFLFDTKCIRYEEG